MVWSELPKKTVNVCLFLQKSNDSIFSIPFVYYHTLYTFSYFYEYKSHAKSGIPEKCISPNHAILPQNDLENPYQGHKK